MYSRSGTLDAVLSHGSSKSAKPPNNVTHDDIQRHGQGTFPQELTVDRLVAPLASVLSYRHDLQGELMDVRRMFEPAVARVAATRLTDDDLADLEHILDAQCKKLKTGRSAIVEDTAFHQALARAARNRVVVSIMATLNDLLVESRKRTLRQEGRPGRSILGHEAVVAALRRRDPHAAAEAMREHINQIADLLQDAVLRVVMRDLDPGR